MAGQIVKAKVNRDFVQLKNKVAQDTRLSWQALGLLTYIQSLPDNWVLWKTKLYDLRDKNARTSTESAFNELEQAGYILSVEKRDTHGHFQGYDYIVYSEIPIAENQQSGVVENPIAENPIAENQQLQKHTKQKHSLQIPKEDEKISFFIPPSESECEEFYISKGLTAKHAKNFFDRNKGFGWRGVDNWRALAESNIGIIKLSNTTYQQNGKRDNRREPNPAGKDFGKL